MGCKECGKPKCDGQCGCKSPAVLQINNPAEYITFHKVSIPAAMGDSTANPPAVGKYKNVLLYYEADQTSWLYSTDGIPTKLTNGITNYEDAINLPQINGHTLIGNKTSHELGLQGELTAGDNIQIENNTISATDTTYTAGRGLMLNGAEFSADIATGSSVGMVKPGIGLSVQEDGTLDANVGDGLEVNGDNKIDIADPAPAGFWSGPESEYKCGSDIVFGETSDMQFGEFVLVGKTEQDGTPSINSAIGIQTVTGMQQIQIIREGGYSETIELNLGKNLFISPNHISESGYKYINRNSFLSSYAQTTSANTSNFSTISVAGLQPNTTYTLSYKTTVSGDSLPGNSRVRLNREGGWTNIWADNGKLSFTTGNTGRAAFGFYNCYQSTTVGEVTITWYDIQLEKGSSATDFVEYVDPIELVEVEAARDEIRKVGSAWVKRKAIGKIASYNGETISSDYISTTGSLTTGAIVYYVLDNTVDEGISNLDLISKLESLRAKAGSTSISVSGNLPAEICAEAFTENFSGIVSGLQKEISDANIKLYDSTNPIYYGADPTGTKDSASSINACILANRGGGVRFTPGTYLVSEPIITPYFTDEQVNIDFGGATIKATQPLDYVLGIGVYNSDSTLSPNRGSYSARATYAIFENFVIEGNGSAVGVFSQQKYWHMRLLNGSIFNSKIGVKAGQTSGNSTDLAMDNVYIQCTSYDDTDSIGIQLNGSDNKITNCRIYNAFLGMEVNGSANFFINNHFYLYGHLADRETPEFAALYPQTIAIKDNGNENLYDCVYTDTYATHYKFSGNDKIIRIVNGFLFTNVTGFDDTAFDFTGATVSQMTIENNRINLTTAATYNYGIKFGSRRPNFAGLSEMTTLTGNYCKNITEDLILIDSNKQIARPYIGATQMSAGVYYVIGYVAAQAYHGVTVEMIGTGTGKQKAKFTLDADAALSGVVNLGEAGSDLGIGAKIVTLKDGLDYVEISVMRASAAGATLGIKLDQWANLYDLGIIPYYGRFTQTSTLKTTVPEYSTTFGV